MKPFQARLAAAKRYCEQATSLKLHPLKNTHANDVPVLMATFAAAECQELEAEVAGGKDALIEALRDLNDTQARLDRILSGERVWLVRDDSGEFFAIESTPGAHCYARLPEREK